MPTLRPMTPIIEPDKDFEAVGRQTISKQMLHRVSGAELVQFKQDQGKQDLGFTSRPFVLCGLPLRRPAPGHLLYERRHGHFVLQVTGHPDYGLPFGQDRVVPIFLATLAVRQQSQTIRFRPAAEMLETFGMHKSGKQYRRLVGAFERVFGATTFFSTDTQLGTAKVIHTARFNFFREAQIWYNRNSNNLPPSERFENTIVLSDEFYRELMSHPIPTDLEARRIPRYRIRPHHSKEQGATYSRIYRVKLISVNGRAA